MATAISTASTAGVRTVRTHVSRSSSARGPVPAQVTRCNQLSSVNASFASSSSKQQLVPSVSPLARKAARTSPVCRANRKNGNVVFASAAEAAPVKKWEGAKMKELAAAVVIGVVIWFLPPPAGVTIQAWKLLSIFVATIVGIILQPLPLGAVAMIGLGVSMVTKVLTFPAAFSAFATEIPWLIAIAFFIARGFIDTGLGNRIAYMIVSIFGKTSLGLTYSLVFSELLLAPAIPSLGARAGGIFLPLSKSLCLASGSDPANNTEGKLGSYLMFVMFQASCISSSMFITAMAANPLSVTLAAAAIGHTISWGQWAMAAFVPGLICTIAMPLILYVIYPPELKETPEAPKKAKEELAKLGAMSSDEKIMAATLSVTVLLWIVGPSFGIGAVAAALVGLTVLMVTGVVTWKKCLNESGAWDTLTWFAALIAMAGYLNKFGLIKWFSDEVVKVVGGLGLGWQPAFLIIVLIYFYSHYMFASGAAHIGAMYTAFLSVAVACGCPPVASAIVLGCFSNLMGCTTHYGIGSAPPIFATGYVPLSKWWILGGILSVFYIAVWLSVGSVWWKVIGLY